MFYTTKRLEGKEQNGCFVLTLSHSYEKKQGQNVITQFGVLILILLSLSGCEAHYRSPDTPEIMIPDRSSEVKKGAMERTAVRSILGQPYLTSNYWGFDLFRSDTEQSDIIFAVTPLPVPMARVKDQLHRYTLVAYDTQGNASDISSGLFRKPTQWRNLYPIEFNYLSLHLRSGALMFYSDPEGARDINMLIAPSGRDVFLQNVQTSNSCIAILGCTDKGCSDQLSVDKGAIRSLPLRNAHAYWFQKDERDLWLKGIESSPKAMPWLESLVALKLSAGKHTLDFSAKYLDGTHSMNFECRPGEVNYLQITASFHKNFWKSALTDWRVDHTDTMPESFLRRPLVLMNNGEWYVEAEPSD